MKAEDLTRLIYGSMIEQPCVILGDATYWELVLECKGLMIMPQYQPGEPLRIGGTPIYSNHVYGTEGYWIGEKGQMEALLEAIRYLHFKKNYPFKIDEPA